MKVCTYCGAGGRIVKGLCMRHYTQMRLIGQTKRTKFDKNEFVIKDDHAEMLLYNGKGIVIDKALIDIEDIARVSQYKWGIDGWGYVVSPRNKLRLHRFITGAKLPDVVDHINHDPLDNRKVNLKVCSQQENIWNIDSNRGIRKRGSRYYARIKFLGEEMHLGTFATHEEALNARIEAENKLRK